MYKLMTFSSTHAAIYMEKIALDNNINVKMIPVPRQITASCGISLRLVPKELEKLLIIADEKKLDYNEIYDMDEKGKIV